MQDMLPGEQRQAFAVWLRTGRRPTVGEDGVERKFNPYHDPRNGRFTFAPGGPQSLSRVVLSKRRLPYVKPEGVAQATPTNTEPPRTETAFSAERSEPILVDAVYRPDGAGAGLLPAQYRPPRSTRGSNSRAFEDPMTLEQIFPGLHDAPAGALLTLADNIFDLTGPRDALTAELTLEISGQLIQQIKEIDPSFRFELLGFPTTIEGQVNQINDLRFERAAALARMRGNYEPLQVEAIRFMARNAAPAYEEAVRFQNEGRSLRRSPTAPLSIGNTVDEIVLDALGQRLMRSGINPYGRGPVRLKRRTYTTPGAGKSFRIPDVRIDKLDIDLTIENKTLAKQQMRDFFRSTEPTTHVAIVRPPQTGQNAVYIIVNPGE